MKKIYIALAVVATAMLVSCEKEQSFNENQLGENDIAFVLQSVSSRSMEEMPDISVQKGITIPMGRVANGESLYLEETVVELNPSPSTKGAPAYTVNVGDLYKTMGVYATEGNFGGEASFEVIDEFDNPNGGKGWRYHHNYDGDPWPDEETPVNFYLRMPDEPAGITGLTNTNKKTTFSYTSPYTAEAQEDILFSQVSVNKKTHNSYLPKGTPVMMYHALTGIKFRSGHPNETGTKTIITGVKLTNLYDKGDCTVDLSATDKVKWDNLSMSLGTFTQAFKNQAYSAESGVDGTVDYTSGDDNMFGDSWYSVGNDGNLNNEEGTLTFWFIPQEISDDVQLEVTFRVKTKDTPDGTEIKHTIDFGKLVNEAIEDGNVTWAAGQLRTYTLKPLDVDVDIFDKMDQYVKSDLHVTNTGNVDEYVRMLVIGNWYGWESQASKDNGDEPSILVGYTSADPSVKTMVTPWTRWETDYGVFDSSYAGGELAADREDWVRASGGYYFTKKIGPGEPLPNTDPLFETYTLDETKIPTIYIVTNSSSNRVPAVGVHLVMEVVVQAIGVQTDENGNELNWLESWRKATGSNITVK